MMKRLAILLTSAIAAAAAYAGPVARWLETEHHFGAFDENDGNVTCSFRVVNDGDEPLMIMAVRTSCGCTTSTPPREPVMPGDTALVSATYNPTGRPGRFEKMVYVDTNADPKRYTLTIRGTVIGDSNTLRSRYPIDKGSFKLRSALVPFGEVKKDNIKSEFFEMYNVTGDTLYPRWTRLPDYLRAQAVSDAVPPGEQIAYAMLFDSSVKNVPYGLVSDTIYISPGTGEPEIPVNIVAMVSENFSRLTPKQLADAPVVVPETTSIDFGTFPATQPITRTFTVGNRGKSPLIIRRAYSADPGVSVKVNNDKVKRGKKATVAVTVDPSLLPSEILMARITLITNDPDNPVTIIRAVGFPSAD